MTGVDIKKDCIDYANANAANADITFIQQDYRDYIRKNQDVDIIITSLFCHHLKDAEIVDLLEWMASHAKVGFIINDLHRHWLAYYSIKWLTQLFSKSYLVKNDAPLSVHRAFKRRDWQSYIDEIKHSGIGIKWSWAFRWLIWAKTSTETG